jgi:hypothetical protein
VADAGREQGRSLANVLVATADKLRAIQTTLGFRPFRVYLVKGHWTGDRKGHGELEIDSRCELTPRPQVRDLSTLNLTIRSTGRVEDGDVYVDEISARYTENELTGRTPDLADPAQPRAARLMVEFWWEIEEARPGCPEPAIRAFVPRAVPGLKRDQFMWTVTLAKREYDRGGRNDPARSQVVGG